MMMGSLIWLPNRAFVFPWRFSQHLVKRAKAHIHLMVEGRHRKVGTWIKVLRFSHSRLWRVTATILMLLLVAVYRAES